jgi:NAD-dependent SIR2 family protein deacetylase
MSSPSITQDEKDHAAPAASKTVEVVEVVEDDEIDKLTEQVGKIDVTTTKDTPTIPVLEASKEIRQLAQILQDGKAKKIIVLSGAGVSVAAGIPDFRTPGTGLYDNLAKYNLPFPEAVFDVQFYRKNPQPFISLAKEIWPGMTHSPTLTHSFLKLLSDRNLLLRNYSQNIDGLEFLAEIPADELVECHGHFRTASCTGCGKVADGEQVKRTILQGEIPTCRVHPPQCQDPVKPDIVFFGESLPDRFHQLLKKDLKQADLLLIMGTSLQVAPVSQIPNMVSCPRVLFNRDLVLRMKKKDVFVEGDCDTNVELLCQLLGWDQELREQNKKTNISDKKKVVTGAAKAEDSQT